MSGMNAKFSQKMAREAPNATEGTIIGMLTSTSKTAEGPFPIFLRAIIIAIGKPITTFSNVTTIPTKYERAMLCQ